MFDTYTAPIIESDKLDDQTLRAKLIYALEYEQLWGFDYVTQALQAIVSHEDFAERWESSPYTTDLAYTYRARKLRRLGLGLGAE